MELSSTFLQQSITFFAIMDPIGISAIALSMLSPNITKAQMAKVAFKSTLTITIAFFVVLITGDFILKLFGIGENSLKAMGGLILLLMAISMVNGSNEQKTMSEEEAEEIAKKQEELSIVPIGIPIAFGTGLFTTIIIFKHQVETAVDTVSITAAFLLNALIFYLVLRNSIYIRKYLGLTGQNIITKLMGLIVGAIAIQFIISGVMTLAKGYL